MSEKDNLIEDILELEMNMFFKRSIAATQQAARRTRMLSRLHRRAQFSVWSEECLQSYLRTWSRLKNWVIT